MFNHDSGKPCSLKHCLSRITYKKLTWWMLLLTAVLAIPAFALLMTATINSSGAGELVIFVLACWLCTWLGLALMKNSRVTPVLFEQSALSEAARQRAIGTIEEIEAEVAQWKERYAKSEAAFMGFPRQPSWQYLDEIVAIMGRIRESLEHSASVAFADITALSGWLESARPHVVDGYLQALKAIYGYAKAELAQQGKSVDTLFPSLDKAQIETPARAVQFAAELLAIIKGENSGLAQANLSQVPFTARRK